MVLNNSASNRDARGRANIESIGVVPERSSVTSRVVHVNICDSEVVGAVDRHQLDWGVDESETRDGGGCQGVGVEELGLGFAAVGALKFVNFVEEGGELKAVPFHPTIWHHHHQLRSRMHR